MFKINDKVKIIKYHTPLYGVIINRHPMLSKNMKKVIAYWYHVKYTMTDPFFCREGDVGLYVKKDLWLIKEKKDAKNERSSKGLSP